MRLRSIGVALATASLATGCTLGSTSGAGPAQTLPAQVVPVSLPGYQILPEPGLSARFAKGGKQSLISKGEVFVIRNGATVEGSVQVTLFRTHINGQDPTVQQDIEKGLDTGARGFQTLHFGLVRLLTASVPEEQLYLWFPAEHNVMELFVMRSGFAGAGSLVRDIVAQQVGLDDTSSSGGSS